LIILCPFYSRIFVTFTYLDHNLFIFMRSLRKIHEANAYRGSYLCPCIVLVKLLNTYVRWNVM
jgi:hypothetical protein